MGIKRHKSVTLIEIIVAVGVVGLILPTVFNITFMIIRQQLVFIAYQQIKQQGDSVEQNLKNLLQNRAAYISDSNYVSFDICPVINETTPTPASVSDLYVKDREGNAIHLYSRVNPTPPSGTAVSVASDSGDLLNVIKKTYYLSSSDVTISNLSFTCYHTNEFSPPLVFTRYDVFKSTAYKDISFSYEFNTQLRAY